MRPGLPAGWEFTVAIRTGPLRRRSIGHQEPECDECGSRQLEGKGPPKNNVTKIAPRWWSDLAVLGLRYPRAGGPDEVDGIDVEYSD